MIERLSAEPNQQKQDSSESIPITNCCSAILAAAAILTNED